MPQVTVEVTIGPFILRKMFNLAVVPETGDFIHWDTRDTSRRKAVVRRDFYPMNKVTVVVESGAHTLSSSPEVRDYLVQQQWEVSP